MATEYVAGKTKTLTPKLVSTLDIKCITINTIRRIPEKSRTYHVSPIPIEKLKDFDFRTI
jgi:hypothetical protein